MKLAAIDIGSNSIHMVIMNIDRHQGIEVIDREKEMVKLGAGVFSTHKLSERAFQAGLETLRKYVMLADSIAVDEIQAVATSAVREAHNGGEFLTTVARETGISPRVVSGKEEARLIFLAVRKAINLEDGENALVLDIGGGSLEVVVGNNREVLFGESVKLGVQRLKDMIGNDAPVGPEAQRVLEAHIRYAAEDLIRKAKAIGFQTVIGTSGTIRTLGEAAHIAGGSKAWRSLNAEKVSLKELKKITTRLLKIPPEKRATVNGISEQRADAIHLGGVLLVQLLEMIDTDSLVLCDASLREGVAFDYLDRHPEGAAMFPATADVRHRSVLEMARKYGRSGDREEHISKLALDIFEALSEKYKFGEYERDILRYSAMLHSIGQYIGFKRYHKHTLYIIHNAGLRGFTDEEVMLIGYVASYHRKEIPQKSQTQFGKLTKKDRRIIEVLSGVLRIAVGLDRGHNQLVEAITCKLTDKSLKILLYSNDNLELELWDAERKKIPLENVLGRKIEFVHAGKKI